MTYRADIDGLRAVAILLVIVFHFDVFSVGKAGFIGVDVFFVISGFLITTIIVKDMEAGTFGLGRFFLRRIRRLYPAMLFVLGLYLIFGYIFMLPDAFAELSREVALSQVYVVNFYFWRTVDYFGLQAGSVPLLHMWSLAVEEQFYIFFPIFCLIVWRFRPTVLLPLLISAAIISFLLGLTMSSWKPWAAFYLLPTRAWELLVGCVLALLVPRFSLPDGLATGLGLLGGLLIASSLYLHTPATLIPGWFALLPVTGAALLITAGCAQTAWTTRCLSWPPFVWLGMISYPLYLVHWPVLILIKQNVQSFDLGWRVLGLCLSIFLGWVIYRFVEAPIRHGQLFDRPKPLLIASMGTTGGLLAIAMVIVSQQGLPHRFTPETLRLLSYQTDTAVRYRECEGVPFRAERPLCRLGAHDAPEEILVFGDSHANAFAHAIHLWLKRTNQAGRFTFRHSCLPVSNLGRPDCHNQFKEALEYARATPSIKTVYLASIWRQPHAGTGMMHAGRWVPAGEIEDIFVQELTESVAALRDAGKEVVLIDPFFSAPRHVPKTLAKNAAFSRDWAVNTKRTEYDSRFAELFAAFSRAQEVGASRLSLIEDFCIEGVCSATFEDRPIFSDNNHLADHMSERLSFLFEAEQTRK